MADPNGPHRRLRFEKISELNVELDWIAAAAAAGTLRANGDWSPGQIMGHLASWIEYGYAGYPMGAPPWFIRIVLRWKLKAMLRDGMPRGVRIPGASEGTYGTEPLEFAEGERRLRQSLARLSKREPALYDSPGFGPMSMDQRVQLTLRHAELHLGYLSYDEIA